MARPTVQQGFTLVEVLVVLVILSALAGTISLTLPAESGSDKQAAVERWHRQVQWAADQSLWTGRAHAWEIDGASARVTEWNSQGWALLEDSQSQGQVLPPGLRLSLLEIEGQPAKRGEKIVFRGGDVPVFRLRFDSDSGEWEIVGDPGGRILWQKLNRSPSP